MSNPLIFAADALIRFRQGRMLVHTTTSQFPAFETADGMLIGWLCQFSKPMDPAPLLAALSAEDRAAITRVLEYLRRNGSLVPADSSPIETPAAQDALVRSKNHLRLLARSVYELSCEVFGLGPKAESSMQVQSGLGLERRLMALLAASDGLRTELGAIRRSHVEEQLKSIDAKSTSCDLKLHIGCGPGHLSGWINIDVHPAPFALNILSGLPFADRSTRVAFVSHLLEHLFFPRDVKTFLAELRRVLAPGGIVRIVVPDIEQCIEAYSRRDQTFFASRRETWPWWPENPTRLEDFLAYAGAGAEPAYLFESHKYGYDFETLQRVLEDAGFVRVVRSSYMQSEHPELRVDEVSSVAKARYGENYYSLFVEAQAP